MNCKQGDLAVIVNSVCGNDGKIVRCLELIPAGTPYLTEDGIPCKSSEARWKVDRALPSITRSGRDTFTRSIFDRKLRPLRDNDGQDETLTWAGLPAKLPETMK